MSVDKTVKIRVYSETRAALKELKRGGQSYDAVIRRLIHTYEVLVRAQTEAPEAAAIIHEMVSRHKPRGG